MAIEIRRARKARDWTQAELARRVGVHRNTVIAWEQGRVNNPRELDTALELLEVAQETPSSVDTRDMTETELLAQAQIYLAELARRLATGVQRTVTAPTQHSHPGVVYADPEPDEFMDTGTDQ